MSLTFLGEESKAESQVLRGKKLWSIDQVYFLISILLFAFLLLTGCVSQNNTTRKNIVKSGNPCLDSIVLSSTFINYLNCSQIVLSLDSSFVLMDSALYHHTINIIKNNNIVISYISAVEQDNPEKLHRLGFAFNHSRGYNDIVLISNLENDNATLLIDLENTHKIIEKIYIVSNDCNNNNILILQINAPGAFGSFVKYREIIGISLKPLEIIHHFATICNEW